MRDKEHIRNRGLGYFTAGESAIFTELFLSFPILTPRSLETSEPISWAGIMPMSLPENSIPTPQTDVVADTPGRRKRREGEDKEEEGNENDSDNIYKIKRGDTLSEIALDVAKKMSKETGKKITKEEVMKAIKAKNGIINIHDIEAEKEIILPSSIAEIAAASNTDISEKYENSKSGKRSASRRSHSTSEGNMYFTGEGTLYAFAGASDVPEFNVRDTSANRPRSLMQTTPIIGVGLPALGLQNVIETSAKEHIINGNTSKSVKLIIPENEKDNVYGNISKGSTTLGAAGTIAIKQAEKAGYKSIGIGKKLNKFKMYKTGFKGNQYMQVTKLSGAAKRLGMITTAFSVYADINNPNYSIERKAFNIMMDVVGQVSFIGIIGSVGWSYAGDKIWDYWHNNGIYIERERLRKDMEKIYGREW